MFSHTKKVGSAGRFGVRAGKKIRDELRKIEDTARKERKCPACGKSRVKRKSVGIWECGPCNTVFTCGSYSTKSKKRVEPTGEGGE